MELRDKQQQATNEKIVKLAHGIKLSVDGINFLSSDGLFTYCNQASLTMYGYSEDEILHLHYRQVLADTQFKINEIIQVVKEKGCWRGEIQQKRKNGDLFPGAVVISFLKDDNGNELGLQAVVRDVTETNFLEAQLRQAKKMDALGTLAGGIAHDFNNILAAITANVEMLLMSEKISGKSQRYLGNIENSSRRATDLVKQIMTFSRMDNVNFAVVDLKSVVSEALEIIRATIPKNIVLNKVFCQEEATILADTTQIHQIIINLCTNAYHAVSSQGGEIRVEVNLKPDHSVEKLNLNKQNAIISGYRFVELSVIDDGKGISVNDQERMFDPFYSTKTIGEGTGLGLAVVNGIVESHSAKIDVSSELGKGSCFTLSFPFQTMPELHQKEQQTMCVRAPIRAAKNILLVEDEDNVADLYQEYFTEIGYCVTRFSNGEEALAFFQEKPDDFHVIITDQAMPKMTGKELAEKVLSIRPNMAIVLLTGFSDIINEEQAKTLGIKYYLLKPVSLRQLHQTIDDSLSKEAKISR